MEFSIDYIASLLNGEVEGDGSIKINQLGKIEDAGSGAISFLSNPKYEPQIYNTHASAVIVNKSFQPKKEINTTLIRVEDPYLSFTTLLEEYHKLINFQKIGVEEPAFISDTAEVGKDIYRGAFSYVGANCKIGNNVKIYPNAYIGDNVQIGDHTIIHSGVKIYAGCIVGSHCVIHAGAVIGSDGFGFAPQADGSYKTIPQVGNVVIGHHVDIGANTTIDCATMESTKIGNGVKLDNLIQIAHNVEIGENTVIAAQAGVSGSTKIGKQCVLAGQVGVVGHIKIGDNSKVAAQSGIGKSLAAGSIEMGSPSFDRSKYLRVYASFKNLPDLVARIQQLEKKVLTLSGSEE
ncbi:UDP-3-O-(3-hydroxymyristoyl)glucosamine N-acyltransferase [Porifericola rhodea]|uniref:UDP-3-O-(3-hydroxymyristoyl)glucosamine N-acyltransferase n=1 Tax=Porifericola rhodea TaxID=930972 RepID=UPI00266563A8|nr:UDP-3-O-(3-hydroxymyristoyl)glucosamine N-acyltransferase [Porifericola rhodea]WKN33916.1 UDP-3-O-(3-hydroxymyristoyl)glucosamine N-acyltransferase [Porifericola rhodea]